MEAQPSRIDDASLTSSLVRTNEGFEALGESWNDLLERSDATVFQTFEWQRTWWKFFGTSIDPFIILVHEGEKVRAIAPLCIEQISVGGILHFRQIQFIGSGVSDYLDVIVERGYEKIGGEKIAEILSSSRNDFDVIVLEDIPDRSPMHSLFFEKLSARRLNGSRFESTQCPATVLKENWAETLDSFSKKHRKDVAYELRNINRNFQVQLELTTEAETVSERMDEFVAMHQERWTNAGRPGVFRDSVQAEFHREVAKKTFERGWLFLAFLNVDGKRAAVNYGFIFRSTISTYLNGMNARPEIAKYSPGKVLHALSMEEGIRHGCTKYDFMRGREQYKYALEAIDAPNWTVIMYSRDSSLLKMKFKGHLLAKAIRRRIVKEQTMFTHVVDEHGWLSKHALMHLLKRFSGNLRDSVTKVKAPERSIHDG